MDKLKFREFVWPQNPHTYRESSWRDPEFFTDVDGIETFTELSSRHTVITGEGVFFGPDAYRSFQALSAEMDNAGFGVLVHPVWGNKTVYFTRLELTQEPRENYVSYRFTFVHMEADGSIPKRPG